MNSRACLANGTSSRSLLRSGCAPGGSECAKYTSAHARRPFVLVGDIRFNPNIAHQRAGAAGRAGPALTLTMLAVLAPGCGHVTERTVAAHSRTGRFPQL
jgi:hypothetical protein